jgi:polyisoprenoid-binding protein YceI
VLSTISAAAIALGGVAILAPSPAQPTATARNIATGTFAIDNTHSSLLFRVRYFDSSYFFGRFNEVSGTYKLDATNPADSFIDLTVNVESVDSAAQGRDRHLRNADFFNVTQHPNATFKSTSVESLGNNKFRVTGDFTLRGITKPVTTELEVIGSTTDPRANATRMGFYTEFTINRSDFEVNYGIPAMSDETKIIVSLTGLERS